MRAGIYLRISQDATGQAAGVTRQREDCIRLCESQQWDYEIYMDNDISASTGKARPGYKALLAAVALGQLDAVVAWHPDRLYRKLADLEGLIAAIEARNVVMRTVRAGEIDLSTPTGRMLARIIGATAQAEGEIKSDRWKRSWRQGREQGAPARTGSRLFGYTRDGQIIETEAAIARRMAADLLDGIGSEALANRLEEEGVLTTRGTPWRSATFRQYLSNPRIAGWSTLKGEIVAEGQWEPILDRETWEEVRALIQSRTRAYVPRKSLLNGLIFCGECEHRLITSSARQGIRSYRCPNRPGMRGCGTISGSAEYIEDVVESYARTRLADPAVRQRIDQLRASPTRTLHDLAEIQGRIKELEQQLDEPGTPVATILRAIDRAKERQETLAGQVAATSHVSIPADLDADWPTDLMRRRALVDLVVGRVALGKPKVKGNRFDPTRVMIDPR